MIDLVYAQICGGDLTADIQAAGLPQYPASGWRFYGVSAGEFGTTVHVADDLSSAEQALIDAAVSAYTGLQAAKDAKFLAIDLRTEALIEQGFLFASKVFSLSANAQAYWLGMMVGKDLLTYPLVVNTKDDSSTFSVPDSTTVIQMYGTAMGTVKAHLASGTALKDQVRAATTVAEVDAVVDNR